MKSSNKVVLNTGILYGRMLITMGVSLYSTKIVLNALGSTDYGIFNLVAGVIAMLSFLNVAMTTSTQRYLSYHQGKDDIEMQKRIFTNSFLLHIVIGLIIVIGLEFAGLFLFHGFLNIPASRVDDAKIIYHFMSATVFFTIIAVPFNGSLTAHENMLWIAFINIVETSLKLGIAFLLLAIHSHKLVVYGMVNEGVSMVSFILYATYCFKKYEECTVKNIFSVDRPLIKELTSFAGWNLFGSICSLARTQGLAVILNIFFGAFINAAYGIANQIGAQLLFFSTTMLRAINPQIMKSEGAGDRQRMLRLSMIASKFGFFLLSFFAVPLIFEMKDVLTFWLKNVPNYAVIFCQLVLIGALINQLTIGLQSALQATGKIKAYQIFVGGLILLNLPLAYFLLKSGFPPYSVLVSYASIELFACISRLYFAHKIAGLNVELYLKRVIAREAMPILTSILVSYLIIHYLDFRFRFILTAVLSNIFYVAMVYLVGLCKDEKIIVNRTISGFLIKMNLKSAEMVQV
jgi:O-antigen/teichoic acid export membrane protein